jgi:5-methylcytosine-specific restriction endonuclease McrA
MKPRSNHLCYNCGIREVTTLDHVISKTLIPEPRPNNLVTVPACKECNGGFSKEGGMGRGMGSSLLLAFNSGSSFRVGLSFLDDLCRVTPAAYWSDSPA